MILLIQAPFTQLNAPYPAIYYLKSFLEAKGRQVQVHDHSIELFERIFSPDGLKRIFTDIELIHNSEASSVHSQYLIERFISQRDQWISCIQRLIAFLRGKDPEYGHVLSLANGVLPSGPRTYNLLASLDGDPSPDQGAIIASAMLADLADFITNTLDPNFSLIRYGQSLAAGVRDYRQIEGSLGSYILNTFYSPFLLETWQKLASSITTSTAPFILGFSIPFPGCLSATLFAARSAKAFFGSHVRILAGGGYVNTELRSIGATGFFDQIDYLCFDRGYGAFSAVLEFLEQGEPLHGKPVYKTIYRNTTGSLVKGLWDDSQKTGPYEAYAELDASGPLSVFPDYKNVDFTRYIRAVDDSNPMHRLWTDGRWLKAYLAHGCYWHSCAFCDVTLDYIHGYVATDVDTFFNHMVAQAESTGIRGLHLVDEAAPARSLMRLAELNRAAGLPLSFWGNIRFERAFTPDMAALLASGGLLGVSGGIEVASDGGFKRLGKGIGLEEVVRACAAFKEAGILTHAYLIYGYWDQDPQELIDSAEILRQLFAQGLLDSGFWHKFVLTRHSRLYREKNLGKHDMLLIEHEESIPGNTFFADNDLHFQGEERYDIYTTPLDSLLSSWMAGDTETPVNRAFPYKMPKPGVPANRVELLLHSYAVDRDRQSQKLLAEDETRVFFLGSQPVVHQNEKQHSIRWWWRMEHHDWVFKDKEAFQRQAIYLQDLLTSASQLGGIGTEDFFTRLKEFMNQNEVLGFWHKLRKAGLVELNPLK